MGTKAQYRVYVFDGDFNRGWMHPECFVAMNKSSWDVIGEEFIVGENTRGKTI